MADYDNGKFGNGTDTAVKSFQSSKSLSVDGKAGKATLTALDKATSGGGSGASKLQKTSKRNLDPLSLPLHLSTPSAKMY